MLCVFIHSVCLPVCASCHKDVSYIIFNFMVLHFTYKRRHHPVYGVDEDLVLFVSMTPVVRVPSTKLSTHCPEVCGPPLPDTVFSPILVPVSELCILSHGSVFLFLQ